MNFIKYTNDCRFSYHKTYDKFRSNTLNFVPMTWQDGKVLDYYKYMNIFNFQQSIFSDQGKAFLPLKQIKCFKVKPVIIL